MNLDREGLKIISVDVYDIRFPTSLGAHGSDAMHTDPDYSCAYVILKTENNNVGYGLTFTLGRGTEIVVAACNSLKSIIVGVNAVDIFQDFASYWRKLTSESQIRWIGPEKGVVHLAVAAIVNSLWDLWGRIVKKPVWKLLTDLTPEELVSVIDFRYLTDAITPTEAINLLNYRKLGKDNRMKILEEKGYPAYTTQVGWIGYSDDTVRTLTEEYLKMGYTAFKIKVGIDLQSDRRRCELLRDIIGYENNLMVDANQAWDVETAISWMKSLAKFRPLWIEEPTSPDDVMGHSKIAAHLKPFRIGVATGEMCANRVMFKQFIQTKAIEYCQVDSARIGGVNEILAVYLMAHKYNIKVCPHAGGVGLCEMVQHLQMWDYLNLSRTMEGRWIEYVDQQHEHFVYPTIVKDAHYMPPKDPGYSTEFHESVLIKYTYPNGTEWQKLFQEGKFTEPKGN